MSNDKQDRYALPGGWAVFCSCWYGKMILSGFRMLVILTVALLVAG